MLFRSAIGTKASLSEVIASITGIDAQLFTMRREVSHYSIAQRMSWASKRITTKEEDMAYSLMGIFEVNMGIIYGEGTAAAFNRLQEEILKRLSSRDQSLLVWKRDAEINYEVGSGQVFTSWSQAISKWQSNDAVSNSALALSPKAFDQSKDIATIPIEYIPTAVEAFLNTIQGQKSSVNVSLMSVRTSLFSLY